MAKASDKASDEERASELLIQEVDEDLRREQYLKLWKRYGKYAIAGMVAVVLVVAGWQAWLGWQKRQRLEEAGRYAAALALLEAGKDKDAENALAAMASDGSGFAVMAGMQRAELLASGGDRKGAEAAYEQIAASGAPATLRDLATLKEGMLVLDDQGENAAYEARLGAVAAIGKPWRYPALELQALFARKKGDLSRSNELLKDLADDAQAPAGVREQATEILAAQSPSPAPPAAPAAAPAEKK